MRRVALLAYYFPPLGGAGVQRAETFARHLPASGWQPVVVTGPGETGGRWAPRDESLGAGLRACEVVRVPGPEPSRGGGRATRWLRARSPWARWWQEGAAAAIANLRGIDLVLATLSPFEGAAAEAARRLDVPWVADLRDPWALDEMFAYPSSVHRAAELREMGAVLESAAAIVMNTAEARAALLRAFPALEPRISAHVPNGFEPAELRVAPEPRSDRAFRIVHTGYLHTELASSRLRGSARRLLGGAIPGVEVGARSHFHLVAAIDALRRDEPELGDRIELHLAGVTSATDVAAADRPYIDWRGYLSHAESIALMRSADALFLPMHDLPAGRRASIVPGKTYEYLAAGPPIVAAVPDGDARDLLQRAGNALVCRPRDEVALAAAIGALAAGGSPGPARRDVLAEFERRALVARLAGVLDVAAGDQPVEVTAAAA
jgi:glycosyltransferase involved in cell wall biosynthesis